MFDSKIIIYVKFWVQESYWKFLRGNCLPPFFAILSPIFWFLFSRRAEIRPPYLGLLDFFPKNLTYDCSSALKDQFPGKKCSLTSDTAMTQPKNQKSSISAQFGLCFSKIVGAPQVLRWGCISLPGIDRSTQNYHRKWDFWKNIQRDEILGRLRRPFGVKLIKMVKI